MRSKKQLLRIWKIYAVLDASLFPDTGKLLRKFKALLDSPVDAIQLRFKDFTDLSLYRAAEKMAALSKARHVPLIINDRPEIALSLGASGVHLGKSDISISAARRLLGGSAIIGCTIRGPEDLDSLIRRNADYVSVGPFFRTPLKPELRAVSRKKIRELVRKAGMPLIAIGGINSTNIREVTSCGIHAVAFVRYAAGETNTRGKIELLRDAMTAS